MACLLLSLVALEGLEPGFSVLGEKDVYLARGEDSRWLSEAPPGANDELLSTPRYRDELLEWLSFPGERLGYFSREALLSAVIARNRKNGWKLLKDPALKKYVPKSALRLKGTIISEKPGREDEYNLLSRMQNRCLQLAVDGAVAAYLAAGATGKLPRGMLVEIKRSLLSGPHDGDPALVKARLDLVSGLYSGGSTELQTLARGASRELLEDYASLLKQFDALYRQYSKAGPPKASSKDAEEQYRKGMTAYIEDRYEAAINHWKSVLKIDPDHEGAKEGIKRAMGKLKSLED